MITLPSAADPVVSIVIPASATAAMLDACLVSIERHGPTDVAYETIVVLNEADPGSAQDLCARTRGVRVIESPVNLGLAGAGNRGRSVARGRFVLLLHDDAEVRDGWMQALLAAAEAHPTAGAIGSRVRHFDGRLQSAGMVLWSDATTHAPWTSPPDDDEFATGRAVDYCGTSSLLVRAEAWDAVGGLDEDLYPVYYVDVDLAMALRSHGYHVRYEPGSVISHHQGGGRDLRFREFAGGRNRVRFTAKWRDELGRHEANPGPIQHVAGDRRLGANDSRANDSRAIDDALARALGRAARAAASVPRAGGASVALGERDGPAARSIDAAEHDHRHLRRSAELRAAFADHLLTVISGLEAARDHALAAVEEANRDRDTVRATARYPFGLPLAFGLDGGATLFPPAGAHPAEEWGAWMGTSPVSLLLQPLWTDADRSTVPELEIELVAFHFVAGARTTSTVRVAVNGHLVVDETSTTGEGSRHVGAIPSTSFEAGGVLAVTIESDGARSPRDLGVSDDPRVLSIGLVSVTISRR